MSIKPIKYHFIFLKAIFLASYDGQGNILRTAERFKNIALPKKVIDAIASTYPGWTFAKDTYLVNYYDQGIAIKITKKHKIVLKKDYERINVKCDEEGNFL